MLIACICPEKALLLWCGNSIGTFLSTHIQKKGEQCSPFFISCSVDYLVSTLVSSLTALLSLSFHLRYLCS